MVIIKWLPVVLILLAGVFAFHVWYKPTYQKFYERGISYYEDEEYERASREFLKAISEAQETGTKEAYASMTDAYLLLGEIFDLRLGRYQQAIETYDELNETLPNSDGAIEGLDRMAELYLNKLNEPLEAIRIFQLLLDKNIGSERKQKYRRRMLETLMAMHEFSQVIAEAKAFLEDESDRTYAPALHMLLADALAYQERWEEAIREYQTIRKRYPESYQAKLSGFEIGNCLTKIKRYRDALHVFEEAIEIYPNPEVVRLRIRETRERLIDESDQNPLPEWARKKRSKNGHYKPPMIDPFPEDKGKRRSRRVKKTQQRP